MDTRIDRRIDAEIPEQVDAGSGGFGRRRDDEAIDFENPITTPGGFLF